MSIGDRARLLAAADASAAPSAVRAAFEWLLDQDDVAARLEAEPDLAATAALVMGASRSLTRLVEADPLALDVLDDLDTRLDVDFVDAADPTAALVRWKHLEHLRIAARDITGRDDLEAVGAALSTLASDVLEQAHRIVGGDGLAVIGMGKLGAHELNYSSDIDLMFVGEGPRGALDQEARALLDIARQCFRVDINLRPEGRDGALVRSVESYVAYWERWAQPWEFQALLKAVPIAGLHSTGRQWFEAAQHALWHQPFDADALRSVRALKARAESEVARKGLATREIKRGPGGIRDIEFTVQILQLVHGHSDADLRIPNTLLALHELASAGYVDGDDAAKLSDAYRVFRLVEHRLQLVDDQQVHTIPTDAQSLDHLARACGLRDTARATATEQLQRGLRSEQTTVRSIHERIYFRPLLEAFTDAAPSLSPEAAEARLTAFGFTSAKRTQAAIRELTRGFNRQSRLMQQLLPLLLDWLSASPDPDLGLLVLRNLTDDKTRSQILVETFRDSPDAAQRLCAIVGTSRLLGDILIRNPDLVARLPYAEKLQTREIPELVATATAAVAGRPDAEDRPRVIRRWKDRNLLGIAARDIAGFTTVGEVSTDLTKLAEATIGVALEVIDPQVPFVVFGLGRLGGSEMSYGSDLDLVYAYDGSGSDAVDEANRVANGLRKLLGGPTPAERIYEVDTALRPEGKGGALVRSVEGHVSYWPRSAQTWERLAWTRARTVGGDRVLGDRLLDAIEPAVWGSGLRSDEILDLRRIKARVEGERIPPGEDPKFHLKLGRGSLSDIEFTTQLLLLQYGIRATGTTAALRALDATSVLDHDDAETLADAYRFCELVRNRWFLVNSAPGDALPTQIEPLRWLARSLDSTGGDLRDHYLKVTRRSRAVVERVFYGRTV